MAAVTLRRGRPEDATQIAAIWNPIIAETTVTFTTVLKDPQALAQEAAAFWVAEAAGEIAGFATSGPFRPGPGYHAVIEHSVHVAPAFRAAGVGRALMGALEHAARAAGKTTMIAAISGENPGAVAFHAALGFAPVGRLPGVGAKFDRRIDLILMQKDLSA